MRGTNLYIHQNICRDNGYAFDDSNGIAWWLKCFITEFKVQVSAYDDSNSTKIGRPKFQVSN